MGLVDRLMRSSVDRALKMQPRRVRRVADETRYAAPRERDRVEEIRMSARRLADARFAVAGLSLVAVGRDTVGLSVTDVGVDFTDIDARHLVTWLPEDLSGSEDPRHEHVALVFAAMDSDDGVGAVVVAHPPCLLAAAEAGLLPLRGAGALGARAGTVRTGPVAGEGVWITDLGVVAAGRDAIDAVDRLEAAERSAEIELRARKADG